MHLFACEFPWQSMALAMVHYAPVVTKLRCVLSRQLRLAVYLPSCATFGFLPWWLTGPNYSLSNTAVVCLASPVAEPASQRRGGPEGQRTSAAVSLTGPRDSSGGAAAASLLLRATWAGAEGQIEMPKSSQ